MTRLFFPWGCPINSDKVTFQSGNCGLGTIPGNRKHPETLVSDNPPWWIPVIARFFTLNYRRLKVILCLG